MNNEERGKFDIIEDLKSLSKPECLFIYKQKTGEIVRIECE